jgi:hypothetical protein
MDSNRIKELQEQTAYPESISVYKALLQVWNECQQEHNEQLRLHIVNQQRELLIAFIEYVNKETEIWRIPIYEHEVDEFLNGKV